MSRFNKTKLIVLDESNTGDNPSEEEKPKVSKKRKPQKRKTKKSVSKENN